MADLRKNLVDMVDKIRDRAGVSPRTMLTDGNPVPADHSHKKIDPASGQQRAYIVLTPDERAKGFVRPVRFLYKHLACGTSTSMSLDIAESFARKPDMYSGGFCAECRGHFPVGEFVWDGTDIKVGT